MLQYRYSPLSRTTHCIRLLRLLPGLERTENLHCELLEYDIRHATATNHLYEALSYIWGSEETPNPIIIRNQGGEDTQLAVTQNLHAALLRLRHCQFPRIIWVDAICINQSDNEEKEHQIRLMAEIYAKANRVIVWLGEAQDISERALEAICLAGQQSTKLWDKDPVHRAVLQLLQRQWFQRIWILQEVAAARQILIMCGSTELDGHAFCLALESLDTPFEDKMVQVTPLIRGAIFRPRIISPRQESFSFGMISLGELVDMYHTHKATKRHDKVYALLGMCSDDLSKAGLEPNYNLEWKILLRRLVKFLLGDGASVQTWNEAAMASIKIKGCVLGKVSAVETRSVINRGITQYVETTLKNVSTQPSSGKDGSTHWTLRHSAKPIQVGDLLCLFQGAARPTFIRLREDYFAIVMVSASPPEYIRTESGVINWPDYLQPFSFTRDFLVVWDWEMFSQFQRLGIYEDLVQSKSLRTGHSDTDLEDQLSGATRLWNVSLVVGDLGDYELGEKRLREAIQGYEKVTGEVHQQTLQSQHGLTPLAWAAGVGNNAIVDLLLTKDDVDVNLKDTQYNRTPLSWAAENGHQDVVEKLLATGKVDVNSKDSQYSRTPLSWAAENGHATVIKQLLDTGKVDIDSNDRDGRTPLSWAAANGHIAIFQQLLTTDKVDVHSNDRDGQTPLLWAARNDHELVVKELLARSNLNSKDRDGRTLLSRAAENGYKFLVNSLLATRRVDINSQDSDGRTPLSWAAENGHEVVFRLLLANGKTSIDLKDDFGRTPLSWAAGNGHVVVFNLLLYRTNASLVDLKDNFGRTTLSRAAENGNEMVVKALLATYRADVNSKDENDRTPLSWAAENGHEAVVKVLLLSTYWSPDRKNKTRDMAEIHTKDKLGRTPLLFAAENGHDTVVEQLLTTSRRVWAMFDADAPLQIAAERGHQAVVALLSVTGMVNDFDMALRKATRNGHTDVVNLLVTASRIYDQGVR